LQVEEVKRPTVATNLEIIAIIIAFLLILFFLFPKGNLQNVVLKESSNYDLTISYLKSLMVSNPKNQRFKSALLELYLKTGKIEELEKLLNKIGNSKDAKFARELKIYRYTIFKRKKEVKKMAEITKEVHKQMRFYKKRDIKMMVEDMMYLKQNNYLFDFATEYINTFKPKKNELTDIARRLYYRADEIKDEEKTTRYLELLLRIDRARWLQSALFYYQDRDKNRAIKILKEMIINKPKIKLIEQLAYFYITEKRYKEASLEYEKLISLSQNKFKYLKLAVNSLMIEENVEESFKLLKKYEMVFVKDLKVANYIVKLYLGLSKVNSAKEYSKLLLKANK